MKIKLSTLKKVIKEAVREPLLHGVDWRGITYCDPKLDPPDGEWTSDQGFVTCPKCLQSMPSDDMDEGVIKEETVRTSDGRRWAGDREMIYTALVQFGTSNAEREAIISGQIPISSAALSFLKSQRVVAQVVDKKPAASHEKNLSKFWGQQKSRGSSFASAQNKFDSAVKKFAKNWENFMAEMGDPDLTPDQAAPDAALGFFYDYPEWEKWSKTLGMSKATMKDVVADSVYNAMLKGQR